MRHRAIISRDGTKTMATLKHATWTLWRNNSVNGEESRLLRRVADDVPIPLTDEGRRDVETLIDAFLERNDAAGLAAPQIGMSKRIVVFKTRNFGSDAPPTRDANDYEVLINPRITQYRGVEEQQTEGCLSCPEISADVTRWTEVKVKAFDRTGRKINRRYTGFPARVVQHELDHLEGILIVDRADTLYFPREKKQFFETMFQIGRRPTPTL
jgi:peptide deformylase